MQNLTVTHQKSSKQLRNFGVRLFVSLQFAFLLLLFHGSSSGQESDATPEIAAQLSEIERSYEAAVQAAEDERLSALSELVKELTRAGDYDAAEMVQAKLEELSGAERVSTEAPSMAHPAAADFLEALSEYRAATSEFDAAVEAVFEEQISKATEDGDLAKVRSLQSQLELVQSNAFAPVADPELSRAIDRLTGRMERQQVAMERARNTSINRMVADGSMEEANQSMQLAMEAIEGHSRWIVLFLGTDSSAWNTESETWNAWSRPLSEAPSTTRFARVRRLDTGDSVIVPIEAEHLAERYVQGTVGWSGDGYEHEDIYHIGVFKTDVRVSDQGVIVINRDGFTPYTGWGFGHRHNQRGQGAALAWAGREVPLTALEVSVTTAPLTATERRMLLFDPR